MKKSNGVFIISVIVIIVALLVTLGFLNKHQTKQTMADLPTYEMVKDKELVIKDMNLEKQPMLGDDKSPVTIIEFGDFKCPACKNWEESVFPQINKEYIETGKVKFYFINYQFIKEDSILAGIAGEAIYHQDKAKFWEFYDKIYKNQGLESNIWATKDFLRSFVRENIPGINYDQFEKEINNFKYLKEVKEDMQIGNNNGVKGTPSILVNGKQVQGDFASIKSAIEEGLKGGN